MGTSTCASLPIGNYCCRPYTDDEGISVAGVYMSQVNIPLLYPGMNGTLTISVSQPQNIRSQLK
jgi:hypothetical protein